MTNKDSKEDKNQSYKTLEIEETLYKTLLTSKFENRTTWIKPDEKKVFSLLPGTIVKVEVKKGDKVKSGQKLLVMEAMKMLNLVRSDQNGIIKDVYIKLGDKIPKNMFMLEFE